MSKAAVAPLNTEAGRVLALIDSLTDAEWNTPSGCAGWRVQEVVAHMGAVYRSICGDPSIPSDPSGDAERSADLAVEQRKGWTPAQVAEEYREWAPKGIAALTALQDPPMADTVVPLGNLGAHPMHILGNAIVFDHYCHLRHDIGAAIPRAAALPQDPDALAAILDWMLMGLPQMCAAALSKAPQQIVNLHFTGVAQGDFVLAPGTDLWTVTAGTHAGAPTLTSSAHDFVSWGTQRADWRKTSTLTGNGAEAAAAVLDAINII
jgi:uncharacterized protein (TIGR03083 family)